MGGKKQTKKQTKQHLYFCFVLIFFFIFFLWVFCVWRESSEHFGVIRRSYYYLRIAYISPFLGVSYGKNLWPCSLVPCPPKHDRLHIKCALKTPLVRTTSAHIFTLTHFLIKKKYTEYKIYIKKKKKKTQMKISSICKQFKISCFCSVNELNFNTFQCLGCKALKTKKEDIIYIYSVWLIVRSYCCRFTFIFSCFIRMVLHTQDICKCQWLDFPVYVLYHLCPPRVKDAYLPQKG